MPSPPTTAQTAFADVAQAVSAAAAQLTGVRTVLAPVAQAQHAAATRIAHRDSVFAINVAPIQVTATPVLPRAVQTPGSAGLTQMTVILAVAD